MKLTTLLIILLLSSAVSGQGNQEKEEQLRYMEQLKEASKHSTLGVMRIPTWEEKFIENWELYSKECYADSTEKTFNLFVTWRGDSLYSTPSKYDFDLGMEPNYRGQIKKWIHKDATPLGFIEFLK